MHVDVKYLPRMPDEAEHRYLIAAIDRASRWVYFEIRPDKTAATAAGFLERLHAKAPFVIRTVLTDNGKEFTDRFCAPANPANTLARLRSNLRRARHPAPADQAPASADQRHDRTLQRPPSPRC